MTGFTRRTIRESADRIHSAGRARAVVIELDPAMPTLVGFRLKGTRTTYRLPIAHLFREAVRNEQARQRAERKKQRQAARSRAGTARRSAKSRNGHIGTEVRHVMLKPMTFDPARLVGVIEAREIFLARIFSRPRAMRPKLRVVGKIFLDARRSRPVEVTPENGTLPGCLTQPNDTPPPSLRIFNRAGSEVRGRRLLTKGFAACIEWALLDSNQ